MSATTPNTAVTPPPVSNTINWDMEMDSLIAEFGEMDTDLLLVRSIPGIPVFSLEYQARAVAFTQYYDSKFPRFLNSLRIFRSDLVIFKAKQTNRRPLHRATIKSARARQINFEEVQFPRLRQRMYDQLPEQQF